MSKGSKSSKKEVSRSLTKKWVKKEVKKGQESYHRSRMGQTKEVKIRKWVKNLTKKEVRKSESLSAIVD